jgi:hypothetical protein
MFTGLVLNVHWFGSECSLVWCRMFTGLVLNVDWVRQGKDPHDEVELLHTTDPLVW